MYPKNGPFLVRKCHFSGDMLDFMAVTAPFMVIGPFTSATFEDVVKSCKGNQRTRIGLKYVIWVGE